MVDGSSGTMRRDAARNRERLLAAARTLFAQHGPDVPLEDVAGAAGVSRTTLYRHFATREELAATVFEDSVAAIEARAAELVSGPADIVELLDFVLDMQVENRSFGRVLSGADIEWFTGLAGRTVAAFEPLLKRGRAAGVVHPSVGMDDLMLVFPMAAGVCSDLDAADRHDLDGRVRAALHRVVFVAGGQRGT